MDAKESKCQKFAENHVHLTGCLHAETILRFISERYSEIDWPAYQSSYQRVFGQTFDLHDIVHDFCHGDADQKASALTKFQSIFYFSSDLAGSFERFQIKFDLISKSLIPLSPECFDIFNLDVGSGRAIATNLETYFQDIVSWCQRTNVGYCEIRAMSQVHLGDTTRTSLMLKELQLCQEISENPNLDIQLRLAVALPRHAAMEAWPLVRKTALHPTLGKYLTAVDFCCNEHGFPPKLQKEFAQTLHNFNREHPQRALALLYHVGESFLDKSVESAIRWCQEAAQIGAHRLGHCIALGIEPSPNLVGSTRKEPVSERLDQIDYDLQHEVELAAQGVSIDASHLHLEKQHLLTLPSDTLVDIPYDQRRVEELRGRQRVAADVIRQRGSVIEVCPTSNRLIGVPPDQWHPARRFRDFGLPFLVCTDNPGLMNLTLEGEFEWLQQHLELSEAEMQSCKANGWRFRSELCSGRE
eukprot:TRINITY_DN8780_c0_g1_i1.p1 TRINITY_DN8780_c0_g1~~TRINITY_DN8780_c0_g1_i1.p1  ORF type:complete len:487 (+),score=70.35 TRINITY_DN8780_c0_g1_i1:52-1461(+)